MDLLSSALGWSIILVVVADVFRSVLVPRASARALRLGPIVTLVLFPLWHALADKIGARTRRQTMRASFAPLTLVLFLVIWAATLVLGFGLVFWGARAGFSPGFTGPGDAVFAAGSAFTTMGAPERVSGAYARIAVLGCALSGLAVITVVATFLISIQSGFGRREALVLRLESHVALPPSGIGILEAFARERVTTRIGPFFDAWEAWSAEVALSHRAFPVLMFFRSNDARCEWLAALGAVLEAAALLDANVANAGADGRAGSHFVLRTGTRLLNDLANQMPAEREVPEPEIPDMERFHRHRDRLAAAGFELMPDEGVSLARFVEHHATFAPALGALARRLRIDVDDGREENTSRRR